MKNSAVHRKNQRITGNTGLSITGNTYCTHNVTYVCHVWRSCRTKTIASRRASFSRSIDFVVIVQYSHSASSGLSVCSQFQNTFHSKQCKVLRWISPWYCNRTFWSVPLPLAVQSLRAEKVKQQLITWSSRTAVGCLLRFYFESCVVLLQVTDIHCTIQIMYMICIWLVNNKDSSAHSSVVQLQVNRVIFILFEFNSNAFTFGIPDFLIGRITQPTKSCRGKSSIYF